jgi:hypothetical protein
MQAEWPSSIRSGWHLLHAILQHPLQVFDLTDTSSSFVISFDEPPIDVV